MSILIITCHDPKWINNSLNNINRQTIKTDVLFVLNGAAKNTKIQFNSLVSSDNHADAVNVGIQYAKDKNYENIILFDSDDYYGPKYIEKQIQHLKDHDYVGKKSIYTKFEKENGLYFFERKERCFLFATIAAKTKCFLPVKNILNNCYDWCKRMNEAGYIYVESDSLDYCYLRHNNAHWKLPDAIVKKAWNTNLYFPLAKMEDVNNKIYGGINYSVTDEEIFNSL